MIYKHLQELSLGNDMVKAKLSRLDGKIVTRCCRSTAVFVENDGKVYCSNCCQFTGVQLPNERKAKPARRPLPNLNDPAVIQAMIEERNRKYNNSHKPRLERHKR